MSVRTVKVSDVSLQASELDLKEFFSFSGDIVYLEVKSENEESRAAYVTFKDSQGANTAVLLTGATIAEKTVTISLDPDYELPPGALIPPPGAKSENEGVAQGALRKAEDVVSSMLAKGFILGKDAVNKAKTFDEKHQLISSASIKIASLDQKYGLTEKITVGTSAVNSKMKEMDEKYQVSEKTKSAIAVAEEKVSNAGSAIMKNRYVLTGATWVTGAFNRVAQAAGEVGQKTKEKMDMAEDEQKKTVEDFAEVHLSEFDSSQNVPLEVSTSPKEVSPKALSSPRSSSPKASSSPPRASSPKVSTLPNDASPRAAPPSPKASSAPTEQPSPKSEPAQGLIL